MDKPDCFEEVKKEKTNIKSPEMERAESILLEKCGWGNPEVFYLMPGDILVALSTLATQKLHHYASEAIKPYINEFHITEMGSGINGHAEIMFYEGKFSEYATLDELNTSGGWKRIEWIEMVECIELVGLAARHLDPLLYPWAEELISITDKAIETAIIDFKKNPENLWFSGRSVQEKYEQHDDIKLFGILQPFCKKEFIQGIKVNKQKAFCQWKYELLGDEGEAYVLERILNDKEWQSAYRKWIRNQLKSFCFPKIDNHYLQPEILTFMRIPHLGRGKRLEIYRTEKGTVWKWPGHPDTSVSLDKKSHVIGDNITGEMEIQIKPFELKLIDTARYTNDVIVNIVKDEDTKKEDRLNTILAATEVMKEIDWLNAMEKVAQAFREGTDLEDEDEEWVWLAIELRNDLELVASLLPEKEAFSAYMEIEILDALYSKYEDAVLFVSADQDRYYESIHHLDELGLWHNASWCTAPMRLDEFLTDLDKILYELGKKMRQKAKEVIENNQE